MKNKWKLITGIALMSLPIMAMLYLLVMVAIKSGTFLVLVSGIGIIAAFVIGAGLYAVWLEDNDEHKMTQDAGLENQTEPPTE